MWQEPKLNWQPTDYINSEDFNRIRGNIEYLKDKMKKYHELKESGTPLPDEVSKRSYGYCEYWNGLEKNLQDIVDSAPFYQVGNEKKYYPLQHYIDYQELNRLEKACEIYYNMLIGQDNSIRELSYTLGNDGGIRI